MKLLQRHPWLIDPSDSRAWVPVEATPIVETLDQQFESDDFSSLRLAQTPPWPRVWVEFTAPSGPRARYGIACEVYDDMDTFVNAASVRIGNGEWWSKEVAPDADVKWGLIMHVFVSIARKAPLPFGAAFTALDPDGVPVAAFSAPNPRLEGMEREQVNEWLVWASQFPMGVFAFLNCKNVTTRDEPAPPPAVLKKRRKKGTPEIIYKQLIVDGRAITRGPGRDDPEEADFRYHICRGHFADHREHGLFGKQSLRGIYWVPMHARGSRSNGEIVKDYEVRP